VTPTTTHKEVAKMYYTGIDLHRKTSFITTVDAKGQIVKKVNVLNDEATIFEYFLSLDDDILFVTVKISQFMLVF
jgi:hypothetical protein